MDPSTGTLPWGCRCVCTPQFSFNGQKATSGINPHLASSCERFSGLLLIHRASWPYGFWEFSCLCLPSLHRSAGITDTG